MDYLQLELINSVIFGFLNYNDQLKLSYTNKTFNKKLIIPQLIKISSIIFNYLNYSDKLHFAILNSLFNLKFKIINPIISISKRNYIENNQLYVINCITLNKLPSFVKNKACCRRRDQARRRSAHPVVLGRPL